MDLNKVIASPSNDIEGSFKQKSLVKFLPDTDEELSLDKSET